MANDASNNIYIVAYVFVAAVTYSSSRCLATIWRYTYRHTDWWIYEVWYWDGFRCYDVKIGSGNQNCIRRTFIYMYVYIYIHTHSLTLTDITDNTSIRLWSIPSKSFPNSSLLHHSTLRSLDNEGLMPGRSKNRGSVPGKGNSFSSFPQRPDWLWSLLGYRGAISPGEKRQEHEADHSPTETTLRLLIAP
jgi:hypothetical protein